jgi:hypothetical protein
MRVKLAFLLSSLCLTTAAVAQNVDNEPVSDCWFEAADAICLPRLPAISASHKYAQAVLKLLQVIVNNRNTVYLYDHVQPATSDNLSLLKVIRDPETYGAEIEDAFQDLERSWAHAEAMAMAGVKRNTAYRDLLAHLIKTREAYHLLRGEVLSLIILY